MSEWRLCSGWIQPRVLPEGWRSVRISEVARTVAGGRLGLTKELDYRASGVPAYSAAGQDGYVEVAEYDNCDAVILSSVGANCGKCFLAEGSWTTLANVQAILVSSLLSARFLLHRVDRHDYWPRSGTAQPFIKPSDIGRCWLSLPPLREQQKIAEILDTVDEAIHKTDQIIAKLKLVKQGLLHDLLTRGIDGNGELRDPERHPEQFKDSPLGRIPKVWDVVSIEGLSELVTSGSRGWAAYYADHGAIFIRIGNLTRLHVNLPLETVQHVQPPRTTEGQRTMLIPGDILISITADLGIVGIVPPNLGEAYINQHIALVRLSEASANNRWVAHFLAGQAGQRQIRRLDDSGAKAGLNLPTVKGLLVALPPRQEQDHLAQTIDAVDLQIASEEREKEKLVLLESALMHDLLTGKVRTSKLLEAI